MVVASVVTKIIKNILFNFSTSKLVILPVVSSVSIVMVISSVSVVVISGVTSSSVVISLIMVDVGVPSPGLGVVVVWSTGLGSKICKI